MSTTANATFEVKSWDENPTVETDGGLKITRATVAKSFKGDIEGVGTAEYVMAHSEAGTATFVGMELITGSLAGKSGSFVLEHTGTFEGGVATATWKVVPGSGTGELTGLRGEGGFASTHADQYAITLDYDFD